MFAKNFGKMQTALENRLHLFDMFAAIWALMKSSMFRNAALLFLIPAGAFSATNVVNLSHYDMMRPDFATMKRQGIVGVIHEATYPPFVRDPKYLDRQMEALQAGLLWGAYHYANGSDPIRQADHFLSVVSSAWAQANPAVRPSAGVLLGTRFRKEWSLSRGNDARRPGRRVCRTHSLAHRCISRHLFGRIPSRAGFE